MTSSNTPISIAHVALTVNDLDLMAEFHERLIGLHLINRGGETAWSGTDTTLLIDPLEHVADR